MARAFLVAALLAATPLHAQSSSSLTLSEAYRLALARSESVHIAEEGVADASTRLTGVWTQIGPSIKAISGGTLQNEVVLPPAPGSTSPIVLQPGQIFSAAGQLSQPIFRRGLFDARNAARHGVEANQHALTRTREQLMADVVTAFIGVLRARQQVDLAQAAVQRADTQLTATSARFRAGSALKTAQLLAAIDVSQAKVQLAAAQGEARNQEATFERLVGTPPPATLTLPPSPQVDVRSPALLDRTLQLAAVNRSDLRAQHLLAEQSRSSERALKGKLFWPLFDLNGGITYLYPASSVAPYSWAATLQLTIPLFQTGDEYVQLHLQRIRTNVALLQESLLAKQITEEVRRALNRLDTARQALELANQQVQDAQQNYNLVVNQFKLGVITFLEVANAQAALTSAENLRLVANYDRELALYQWLFVSGQLHL